MILNNLIYFLLKIHKYCSFHYENWSHYIIHLCRTSPVGENRYTAVLTLQSDAEMCLKMRLCTRGLNSEEATWLMDLQMTKRTESQNSPPIPSFGSQCTFSSRLQTPNLSRGQNISLVHKWKRVLVREMQSQFVSFSKKTKQSKAKKYAIEGKSVSLS